MYGLAFARDKKDPESLPPAATTNHVYVCDRGGCEAFGTRWPVSEEEKVERPELLLCGSCGVPGELTFASREKKVVDEKEEIRG